MFSNGQNRGLRLRRMRTRAEIDLRAEIRAEISARVRTRAEM